MSDQKTALANPALKELTSLAGRWDVELRWSPQTHALVGGPGAVQLAARFEWIEEGSFLVQHQGNGAGPPQARWLIGRDETSGQYTVLYADARGVSRVYQMSLQMSLEGRTWKMSRDAPGFSQRFEGRLSPDGATIDGRWEKSTDGQTWEHDFDLRYTRRTTTG